MKNLKTALLLMLLCLVLTPLLAPLASKISVGQGASQAQSAAASSRISASELLAAVYSDLTGTEQSGGTEADFTVYLTDSGEVITLSPHDYLRGAVAAEMPLTYGDEALKAQIIAAHTYALSYKIREKRSPDESLKGADISDDPAAGQAYIGDKEIASRYGDDADRLIEKLDALIAECGDYILLYEGEPIVAAYHAISCGKTESAQSIWGAYSPYLVAVDSGEDKNSPDFLSQVTFSVSEVRRRLKSRSAEPDGEAEDWFSRLLFTPSGYVAYADIGGCQLTGTELRELFGLRSACFSVQVANDVVTFTVKGWGHGVGMSQYGAQMLAREGKDFMQILQTYYNGVTLCEL